jgi:hypothetical protein
MKHIKGYALTTEDQEAVLSAYIHDLRAPLQFVCTTDWLCNTTFLVRNNGQLDNRFCKVISSPTYPNNPELLQVTQ